MLTRFRVDERRKVKMPDRLSRTEIGGMLAHLPAIYMP